MGRRKSVHRLHRPSVGEDLHLIGAQVDHGLHGDGHAGVEALPRPGGVVVGDLRVLVHLPPDAVAHIVADHAVAVPFGVLLHGLGDVGDPIAHPAELESFEEALPRHLHQLLELRLHLPAEEGPGGVPVEPVQDGAEVAADDVAVSQDPLPGDAVDHLVVHRNAHAGGVARVPQEGGRCAAAHDVLVGQLVEVSGGDAGADVLAQQLQGLPHHLAGRLHLHELAGRLEGDHASSSLEISSATASTGASPLTVRSLPLRA